MRGVTGYEDDEELNGAEGHIEEGGDGFIHSESAEDEGTEDVCYGCADVDEEGEDEPEVCFWVEEDLEDLAPFEFAGADTGVVCAEALDGLGALVVGEEAGAFDVVVEFPVDKGRGDDGDEADEEENTGSELVIVWLWNAEWRRR